MENQEKPKKKYRPMYYAEDIYLDAIKAINDNQLVFWHEVVSFLPCSQRAFDDLFPKDSPLRASMEAVLEENKIAIKVGIRKKLFRSEKSAELIALYKLVSTPDERRALSMSYQETDIKGKLNVEQIVGMRIINTEEPED